MSEIILITGGNRSGKSSYAKRLLNHSDNVLYIATAERTDAEMERRIRHHIETRNPRWTTYEGFRNLDEALVRHSEPYVLLDCVTNMISNLMFYGPYNTDTMTEEEKDQLYPQVLLEFQKLMSAARRSERQLILVSNEVGMGLISEHPMGRLFVDFAGFINQEIAKESDRVIFMVSGLPLVLKG